MNVSTEQRRIAALAVENKDRCFISLNHLLNPEWVTEAFRRTRKDGAKGVDGEGAEEYRKELKANSQRLCKEARSGKYKAPPAKRGYVPKDEKESRPIGMPTFTDKVLQRATVMILEPIYEQDFQDCSYGFRPNRSAHQALEDIWQEIMGMKGCWLLDVDIRKFFDTLDRKHLRDILDRRVRDGVLRRLIDKWLKAGVWESGQHYYPKTGTPQGGVISPLLSNIYLHTVLDEWFIKQVKPLLKGHAFLVRYADDFVMGFKHREDAERVLWVLPKRFARYGLSLHPEKTQLVDFTKPTGKGKTRGGTFDFLAFTHYWGLSRRRNWVVRRKTAKDRLQRAIHRIDQWCRAKCHADRKGQHWMLSLKFRGHYAYYGITGNMRQLQQFYEVAQRRWRYWLARRTRGHKGMSWAHFAAWQKAFPLPKPRIVHSSLVAKP
jgi:group II intron reverse transcriptase/maturase